jgi:hypothetical protein
VEFITKHFSVRYDVEERNALLSGDASLPGGAVRLRASHDVKVLRPYFESKCLLESGRAIIYALVLCSHIYAFLFGILPAYKIHILLNIFQVGHAYTLFN